MKTYTLALVCLALASSQAGGGEPYWKPFTNDRDCIGLYRDGKQIGLWQFSTGKLRTYDGHAWGQAGPVPEDYLNLKGAPPIFGVSWGKIGSGPSYRVGDLPTTKEGALAMLEKEKGIPDDAGKPRLVVIGAEAECKQVVDDLASHPSLVPFKDKVVIHQYRPDHWHVTQVGYQRDGHPTIYCQAADGRVLWRLDSYQGGPEELATGLRRLDPNYKPEKDRKPWQIFPVNLPEIPWSVPVVVGAGVVAYIVSRRRKP
jgi:hypothetical protein